MIPSSQAHKLLLAVTSSVFEGMFFGPLASDLREVRIDDVKPAGFRRLIHFIYNSRCLSWKIDDPEEWWFILEAANKYMNSRLVDQVRACIRLRQFTALYFTVQVERRLREIAKRDSGKGVILRHLTMANRSAGRFCQLELVENGLVGCYPI